MVKIECETGWGVVPFRDYTAILRLWSKSITLQVFFGGYYGIRLPLVFSEAADEIENHRDVVDGSVANGEHQ